MVKFRMSIKSDKDKADTRSQHASIPQKDAVAIIPPKKVIKALYDYAPDDRSPNSGYLGFAAGDFLHVVGRENDNDWYEACNPLQNTRGLVPVKYFDIVGKQIGRNSGGSQASDGQFPSRSSNHDSGYAEQNTQQQHQILPQPQRMSRMMQKGGMVYGMVMFNFAAERPDELEAKEGEAIIVIAQSNPEWFVAKPISRLGGPGLIPVSFIEIRDMTTGQPVTDPLEAVRRAGVPKVEEWKKMAAEYKNCSIPLGKLDAQQTSSPGMGQPQQTQQFSQQPFMPQQHAPPASQFPSRPVAPISATVPRYIYSDDNFWFIVEAAMEDGTHWCLQREYANFYDLQISLIQEYPVEAGTVAGHERLLPYMPGPVTYVTDNISNGRRANLDEYLRNLLKLGPHITKGDLVKKFFAPTKGDYEVDPGAEDDYRLEEDGVESQQNGNPLGPSSGNANMPAHNPYAANYSQSNGNGKAYTPPPQSQPQQASHTRNASSVNTPNSNNPTSTPAIKIKAYYGPDNCCVIRLQQNFNFQELSHKLRERSVLENYPAPGGAQDLEISVKDEQSGQLVRLRGDGDLRTAVERNPKLVFSVYAPVGAPRANGGGNGYR